jgi:short-subunit dehydrogenase
VGLSGRRALVTGASSGIGAATAEALAGAGCELVLVGRDEQRLSAVAGRTRAEAVVADLTTAEGFARVVAAGGGVDLLVNNAGAGWAGDLDVMDPAQVGALVDLNLAVPLQLTRALLPGLRSAPRARVVFVSSIAAVGVRREAVYSATKAGLRAFAASLRQEGLDATTVLPGAVRTPFFDERPYERRFPRQVSAERVARVLVRAVERGRGEVFVPGWLSLAARIRGAVPELFDLGARRFG